MYSGDDFLEGRILPDNYHNAELLTARYFLSPLMVIENVIKEILHVYDLVSHIVKLSAVMGTSLGPVSIDGRFAALHRTRKSALAFLQRRFRTLKNETCVLRDMSYGSN
jgi:hypothetical protein